MSGNGRTETAVAAAGVVTAADQIMQAIRDNKEKHPDRAKPHYVKAAIAGAIAIGAFEMLRKENRPDHHESSHSEHHKHSDGHHERSHVEHHGNEDGHTTDLAAEALGAYALGRQILGHTDHHILKLVAEGLGAVALAREASRDLS